MSSASLNVASCSTDDQTDTVPSKNTPALHQPLGYTLLEEYFNSNFPGRELSFVEKWPSMFPVLWDICSQNKKSKITSDYPFHDIEYMYHVTLDCN